MDDAEGVSQGRLDRGDDGSNNVGRKVSNLASDAREIH